MEITNKNGEPKYYLDDKIVAFCKQVRKKVETENTHVVGLFVGKKGGGKSARAQHMGYVMDPTLEGNVSRICMTKDSFITQITSNKKAVVIGDEGISILFKRDVMSKGGKTIKEFWEKMRGQNNITLICIPEITDLPKDILLSKDQINFVVAVTESTDAKTKHKIKGNMRLYLNTTKVSTATNYCKYVLGKYDYKYKKTRIPPYFANQKGDSVKKGVWYPVGNKAYEKLKEDDLKTYRDDHSKKEIKPVKCFQVLRKEFREDIIRKNPDLTDVQLAKVLKISRERVNALKLQRVEAKLRQ